MGDRSSPPPPVSDNCEPKLKTLDKGGCILGGMKDEEAAEEAVPKAPPAEGVTGLREDLEVEKPTEGAKTLGAVVEAEEVWDEARGEAGVVGVALPLELSVERE